jgi:Flp pilus assembly protein TadG
MVTAELAAALPVLVLVLAVALSALSVGDAQVRVQDAAREAARAAARGDPGQARALAERAVPGIAVTFRTAGDEVEAVASVRVQLVASWLPSVTVTERATAALEPASSPP